MKYILKKSAVLSFVALKIIVFSALIFVITGCQRTDSEQSTSGPMPTVVSTKPPSSSQTVVAYNSSPTPMPSGSTRTPSPTPTPTATLTPTATPVTSKPTVIPVPTSVPDQKNTIGAKELVSPTPLVRDEELMVLCSLDSEGQEISCEISGSKKGQNFKWTSNATTRWETGATWQFALGGTPVPEITEVVIEICENTVCTDLRTELDTSHLVKERPVGGVTHGDEQSAKPSPENSVTTNEEDKEDVYNPLATQEIIDKYPVWAKYCTNSGPVMFSFSPMKLEDINQMSPYGDVVGAHITPIDHMYFGPKDESLGRDIYEVRAIQDALIFDIGVRDKNTDTNEAQARDWRLDMAHTCTFASYFDLLTSVTPEIEEKWAQSLDKGDYRNWDGIEVKAGQVIGYAGGQSLDFGVYDWDVALPGLINPEAYANREPWKTHTVDPFQYFPTEIREPLLDKMIRAVEPRAGKIDYDMDGTLSGNWFQIGTDWYNGINQNRYWEGHLSIAPHQIDPNIWRIGIGFLETENNNFVIHGDSDPLDISVGSGPVSYELRKYKVYIPQNPQKQWWVEPHVKGDIYGVLIFPDLVGTVLLSLEENGLLRLEVFMGESKDQINGFTQNARLYER